MELLNNINVERSILSSILYDYTLLEDINTFLNPNDFYLLIHQKIYEVILELYKNDIPVEETFILKKLKKDSTSEKALLEIISTTPIANVQVYALEIKEISRKRQINNIINIIKKQLLEETVLSDDLLSLITKEVEQIENDVAVKENTTKEILIELKNDMEKAALNGEIIGQKTGLKALDNIIGAFEDGDLIVVAARPSMGKTSFISAITNKSLEDGRGVLIESLEMPAKKILARLISARSGEYLSDIKKGLIRNKTKFYEAANFFACENLVIHDKTYPTIVQLQSRIKRVLKINKNIKNIFIDNTGKIQLDGKTREDIEIGHITNMLKKIARDFQIRVFLLQQLNRSVETRDNKRPKLSDLKNSGNIEEDADIVLGLYREAYYKTKEKNEYEKDIENAEIIVLKNRDGETRTAKVSFEGKCARFVDRMIVPVVIEYTH